MNKVIKQTLQWLKASGVKVETKEELLAKIDDVQGWLIEEINEFREAVINDDRPGMRNAVIDATWITHNLSHFAGLTPEELDEEGELVYHSNFSKFCKTEDEAKESVRLYSEGLHPNKFGTKIKTTYTETGLPDHPYVILKEDGKIFKSHNFKDVDVIREQLNKQQNEN